MLLLQLTAAQAVRSATAPAALLAAGVAAVHQSLLLLLLLLPLPLLVLGLLLVEALAVLLLVLAVPRASAALSGAGVARLQVITNRSIEIVPPRCSLTA